MQRFDDWAIRYQLFIDKVRSSPFKWGDFDCGPLFAGQLCFALTGENPASHLIGRYSDEKSAVELMRSLGFDNLADATASFLPEYQTPALARLGDIAAIPVSGSPFGHALGIVNGERLLVLGTKQVGSIGRQNASRAFKVG